MKTQATAWYDTKNDKILHGVKVYAEGQWYNFSENGKAVLFDNEGAMEKKRAELRRLKEFVVGRDGVRVGRPHTPSKVIRTAALRKRSDHETRQADSGLAHHEPMGKPRDREGDRHQPRHA